MTTQTIHPLVASARAFAEETLRPRAGEFDQQECVPRDVLHELAERGLLGAILPREFGGGGLDPLSYGLLTAEIGKGCSSTRALLTVHASLVGETLARMGSSDQKRRWLPDMAAGRRLACFALSEPDIGSEATAVKTSYRAQGGEFVINGQKKWITYGAIADLFLVFAASEGEISAFIVDRTMEGLSTKPMSGLLASRGAHLAEVKFDNVVVPKENLIGRLGTGFTFVGNTALFYGRYSVAWAGVAIAEAAVEEMVEYARNRQQFGKKLRQHQMVQSLIAGAVAKLHAGRALCEKVGQLRNQGDDAAVMEANIAKYVTSKLAMEVTLTAVQVFGGNGCWNAYPVERLFREAKILEIIEGSSQIQEMLISEHAIRHYRRRQHRPSFANV
jgi:alkylation response protein AidB-like acyl-CoA dehydrogenase